MDKKNEHIFMPEDHMDKLYNSSNFFVKFVHNQRLDAILGAVPKKNGLKVLDIGCGEGHLIEGLYNQNPNNEYYGIDITDIAIEKAVERCPYADFKIMDIYDLKFNDNFFDVIIATEVLEHIKDYSLAISQAKQKLSEGGNLIITFPNETLWTVSRFLLGRRPIKVPDHVNSFSPSKFKKYVGFQLVFQENLPFKLPFIFSLGSLLKFKKI